MTITTPEALREAILAKLTYAVGRDRAHAHDHDWYVATALAVRDHAIDRWFATSREADARRQKRVYYLSLEFLIGRLLSEYLCNLQLQEICREALAGLDVDLDRIRELEPDAALGNGGLGRLAACFMESMATVGVAGFGYGIRYQHGLFRQLFNDGWQVEQPEDWLSFGNPWEFERPEICYPVDFGGTLETVTAEDGRERQIWHPAERVSAVAYDTPIAGWPGRHVNTLRLWSARSANPMRLDHFNRGDYMGAVAEQVTSESIVRVLYPNDDTPAGQQLRLKQEYFFTSASLQDVLRRHLQQTGDLASLPKHAALQLNDTHPAIAVAELMRLLVDQHGLDWQRAWRITRGCIAYTNHTLLPEALESWPVALLERLLPRHMRIIERLNDELLEELDGHDVEPRAVALIDHGHGGRVRMGNLAFFGAHKVNGVSALHTELMKQTVFRDLHRLFPDRIVNQTNGITARRWLRQCNPALAGLITDAIGPGWIGDLEQLTALAPLADDAGFRERFAAVKRGNKERLAAVIAQRAGIEVDPDAMFDVHIKRIHEYKRQLLNILEAVALWQAIREEPGRDWPARVKIFGGKAAASYHQAKLIIKLINDVARVGERRSGGRRPPQGRVPAELQCQPDRAHHPGSRSVGADLDRRHGGVGHRQHEARAQRRADDRHAGWRQYRDPRAGGSREHVHLRPDRRGGPPSARQWLPAARRACGDAAARPGDRGDRGGRRLARRSAALPAADRASGRPRLLHGAGRLRGLRRRPAGGRRRLARARVVVPARDPQHRACRLVLVGPNDPRLRQRDLAGFAGGRSSARRWRR